MIREHRINPVMVAILLALPILAICMVGSCGSVAAPGHRYATYGVYGGGPPWYHDSGFASVPEPATYGITAAAMLVAFVLIHRALAKARGVTS